MKRIATNPSMITTAEYWLIESSAPARGQDRGTSIGTGWSENPGVDIAAYLIAYG